MPATVFDHFYFYSQVVLRSQLQHLNNELRRCFLIVSLRQLRLCEWRRCAGPCLLTMSAVVRRQVADLYGADSLIFKEMWCTVVIADAVTTDQSVTANTVIAGPACSRHGGWCGTSCGMSAIWLGLGWRRGIVAASLVSIHEVNLCWTRLVLGWVTVPGFDSQRRHFIQYVNNHPSRLSLLPSVLW